MRDPENGLSYVGEFQNGMFHGSGTLRRPNGNGYSFSSFVLLLCHDPIRAPNNTGSSEHVIGASQYSDHTHVPLTNSHLNYS